MKRWTIAAIACLNYKRGTEGYIVQYLALTPCFVSCEAFGGKIDRADVIGVIDQSLVSGDGWFHQPLCVYSIVLVGFECID